MSTKKVKFQIDLVCSKDELRPAMTGVLIDNGYAVATDGHVLVIMSLEDMDMKYLEVFNGKIIKGTVFKQINNAKYQSEVIDLNLVIDGNTIGNIFIDERFPQYKCILPVENEEVDIIGIDAEKLATIQKAFNAKGLTMSFSGKNRPISIIPNELVDFQAICMPFMFNGDSQKSFVTKARSSELETA